MFSDLYHAVLRLLGWSDFNPGKVTGYRFSAFWLRQMDEVDAAVPFHVTWLRNTVRIETQKAVSCHGKARLSVDHVVKEILQGIAKQSVSAVICLQDFSHAGFMDGTFGGMASCLHFVAAWERSR